MFLKSLFRYTVFQWRNIWCTRNKCQQPKYSLFVLLMVHVVKRVAPDITYIGTLVIFLHLRHEVNANIGLWGGVSVRICLTNTHGMTAYRWGRHSYTQLTTWVGRVVWVGWGVSLCLFLRWNVSRISISSTRCRRG